MAASISGRTSSGRSEARAVSVMPTSICSSTKRSESASSDVLPSTVPTSIARDPGPGSPWLLIWLNRVRTLDKVCR